MSDKTKPLVEVNSGKLEGIYESGMYVFKGIPYAAPPVGPLRWIPPQMPRKWDGVRPAKEFGAIAPQNLMPMADSIVPMFEGPQDEDCLFLNIWTPGLDDAKRPVMFWIHGGAFLIGAGTESFLEGGNLARRGDVVIVSINYRLGALGFINLNEITGGKIPATGNEGLLDQVAALEWVHDNIAAFGGDPDNVTIFGFSAGGMSIGNLLGLPAARGKFHKTINRSGATNIIAPLEYSVTVSERYLDLLGLKGRDVDALRNLTTQQVLDAQQKLSDTLRESEFIATPFLPVVDGKVMPDWPIEAIKKGSAKNIPVMAGNTRDEMKMMNTMDPLLRDMDDSYLSERLSHLIASEHLPGLISVYRAALQRHGEKSAPVDIYGSITTDIMFRIPTIRLVEAQRDQGVAAYNFYFTYKSPAMGGILGAMHGLDNPFVFGNLDPNLSGSGPEVESLSEKIQDSCTAFARTGDPSCESIGKWPVYGQERMTMILDLDTRVEAAPYEDERLAWDSIDMTYTRPL
jgi:para-nitrobenzyl esterase